MKPLLNRLRIRLVLLYLAVGVALAAAIIVSTYSIVSYHLRSTTDEALKQKMGLQLAALDLPMPITFYDSLVKAGFVTNSSSSQLTIENHGSGESSAQANEITGVETIPSDRVEISELADIVVLSLTVEGTPIHGAVLANSWLPVDKEAVASTIVNGSDLRTITLSDGTPVRILTYRVESTSEMGIIQVGRSMKAQYAMLDKLTDSMILIGGISIFCLGLFSWFLAGRSIKPTQLAWERQQTFVANASHELRTPLTLIHAGAEVAQRQSTSESQQQILGDVLSDTDYMTKLIESLLLLSRLDAQHLKLDCQPVFLPDILADLVRQNQRVLSEKEIEISYQSEPITVHADPVRLKQVLLILTDNAGRNNHPGGWIKIHATEKQNKAMIEVSDNGSGIPKELLPKVFDRFFKINEQSTSDYRGSGLGLSIAQGLVQAQNGTIQITSELGKGTLVTITLPVEKRLG